MPEASITCPRCGRTSCNPNDIAQAYCGFCHQFHEMMRFERLIETRAMNNGSQELILACGHVVVAVIPVLDSRTYLYCSACLQEEVERIKRESAP